MISRLKKKGIKWEKLSCFFDSDHCWFSFFSFVKLLFPLHPLLIELLGGIPNANNLVHVENELVRNEITNYNGSHYRNFLQLLYVDHEAIYFFFCSTKPT